MATQTQLEVILAGNRGNIRENVDPNSDEIIRAPPVEELKDTFLESLNQLNKSHTGGDNMRNASDHQRRVKTSGSEKKVNEDRYDLSSKKRVTKKFLEVSRCSRANQRQRNVQKKCVNWRAAGDKSPSRWGQLPEPEVGSEGF